MQSSGDSRGNGVRQAAWGIFHLQLREVGCKVRTGRAQAGLKGSLVLPAICHLSDVTRFIWAAHFKGPLLVLPPSLSLFCFGFCYWRNNSTAFQKRILLYNLKKKKKKSKILKEQLLKLTQIKQGRAGTVPRKPRSLILLPSSKSELTLALQHPKSSSIDKRLPFISASTIHLVQVPLCPGSCQPHVQPLSEVQFWPEFLTTPA